MSDTVNDFLADINAQIGKETNEKITKAMRLFVRCDNVYKRIVLHNLGINEPTALNLREAMDTLDLMDSLDDLIFDMEDDIQANGNMEYQP